MRRNPKFKFRGRKITLIINKLDSEESVLLTVLRRIGKTWAMKESLARFSEQNPNKTVRYIDTQELSHPSQFFSAVLDAMPKGLAEKFSVFSSSNQGENNSQEID